MIGLETSRPSQLSAADIGGGPHGRVRRPPNSKSRRAEVVL